MVLIDIFKLLCFIGRGIPYSCFNDGEWWTGLACVHYLKDINDFFSLPSLLSIPCGYGVIYLKYIFQSHARGLFKRINSDVINFLKSLKIRVEFLEIVAYLYKAYFHFEEIYTR